MGNGLDYAFLVLLEGHLKDLGAIINGCPSGLINRDELENKLSLISSGLKDINESFFNSEIEGVNPLTKCNRLFNYCAGDVYAYIKFIIEDRKCHTTTKI